MLKKLIIIIVSLLVMVGCLLLFFLPKQEDTPSLNTEATGHNGTLATMDSEILENAGQQIGSAIRKHLFQYVDFQENNALFTNAFFDNASSVSLNSSWNGNTISAMSGPEMRELFRQLGGLPLKTTDEYRTNFNTDEYGPTDYVLTIHYRDGSTACLSFNDLCFWFVTLNESNHYQSVEENVYYALTDESIDLYNLILPYFPD